jgi:hypothetical protein
MNAANHVDFTDRFIEALPDLGLNVLDAHLVGERMPLFFAKCTEFAQICADVGIVDVLVIDEKGQIAVLALPDNVGQVAESEDIRMLIKGSSILQSQTFSCTDLARIRPKPACSIYASMVLSA